MNQAGAERSGFASFWRFPLLFFALFGGASFRVE